MTSFPHRRLPPNALARRPFVVAILASAALLARVPAAWSAPVLTVRASVSTAGEQGLRGGERPAISHSGNLVAFETDEAFDPADTNFTGDVYLRDLAAGTTTRVSLPPAGSEFPHRSYLASISGDGSRVSFVVETPTLVDDTIVLAEEVFVRDRTAGVTTRIPLTPLDGAPLRIDDASIAADGTTMVLAVSNPLIPEDANNATDVYVYELTTGALARVSVTSDGSEGDMGAGQPSISADGRVIAFASSSSNLVPGDTQTCGMVFPPQNCPDVFVHDRTTGETRRISTASTGGEADGASRDPIVSSDGLHVAFSSAASNLVAGDTNLVEDAYVFDIAGGTTRRASVSSAGGEGNGASSAEAVTSTGDSVAFLSAGTNLDPGGRRGIFIHRFGDGATLLASLSSDGQAANGPVAHSGLSGNGSFLTFDSPAANLVPNDSNGVEDVFVRSLSDVATKLEAEPVVAAVPGGVTLGSFKARLTTADGSPLALRQISFWVGTSIACSAHTNLDGVATCGGTAESLRAIAAIGYRAVFAGEWPFDPAEGSGALIRISTIAIP